MERILRQLDAAGENLQHSSREIIIESHATNNCDKRKPLCFYCKSFNNTALCPSKYKEATQTVESNEEKEEIESTTITNSVTGKGLQQGKRILLLCKEINVLNPNYPKNQQNALALFDI
ncbi:unnamed protein product, partial [Onchocerca ochengi]|uniref:Eukaryotic translation initiation factor 3 subunit G N-terminal domain-containing protein n=1 Tax=Onchocerca ochengi TaxID=42157 RepID=A0A182EXF7_ONCOC